MVEAARKYKRIVQVGHQGRSVAHKLRAVELLREGIIGEVYMARGLCYKRRKSIGVKKASPVPPGVNYELWLGPSPGNRFSGKPLSLQLALVLAFRQRRHRQPRRT